ncbi:MAG: DNA methyltransferase [Candidatus Colwellbacteria bacterium]|nr:DNA methyltransferase [Candidatus Colwellbacteria bacterium]
MKNINKNDTEFLIDCLRTGKEIPTEYKYALFPTKQKEYELVYAGKARKEDILADNEEAKAVPLQVEKIFNGTKYPLAAKDWHNLLVFGDNLQILKTFYKDEDPLIKGKVKGKVKLIYIDPPFATTDEFQNKEGAKAYSDKKKGAEFVEFLRRRLIVAREILADDGVIFIHLDQKSSHYVKVLMDEIFGKNYFKNEIIWRYRRWPAPQKNFQKMHDVIFRYAKTDDVLWNQLYEEKSASTLKAFGDTKLTTEITERGTVKKIRTEEKSLGTYMSDVWEIAMIQGSASKERDSAGNYPTQKPEVLLERIIRSSTNEGDLVMDFFCGSGTTLAVAEKLGRRWIGCDIGKLAIYTTQKRLLEIEESKSLDDSKKKYGKISKSFGVVTSGLYDLGKVFALKKDEYIEFVKRLFEVDDTKVKSIGGVSLDGKRREFYVKIFPSWEVQNASVDEKYLNELHKNLGAKIDGRMYIIVPANNVHFISDYHEIGSTRYYFLKVPYQIIKELHKVQFKKLHQPQSKKQINDLDEAIGFHFIRQPEVKSDVKVLKDKVALKIKKFESAYAQDELGEKLKNFESLAMVLVDLKYNGDQFLMSEYFFAQDLIGKKDDEEQDDEQIRKELEKRKEIVLDFERKKCGEQMMAIYVDIYGNEFREIFNLK